jgi:hypothetical protein
VLWLRHSVAGLSPRRPEFTSGQVREGLLIQKLVMGQVSIQILQFSAVSKITMLHIRLSVTDNLRN